MRNLLLTTITAVAFAATSARAATLFDSLGFESPTYLLGNLAGQNGWTFSGSATAGVVQNTIASGGSQAVQLSGATTTWAWPSLEYTPAANEIIRVSFDVRRSAFTANNNFGYFVDVYDGGGNNRIARTGLVRTGTAAAPGSVQGLATIGGGAAGNYLIGSPLLNDTWYGFSMDLDFAADTYSISINGSTVSSALPFGIAASTIGDADIQISAVAGGTDTGFIDNYWVQVIQVPEPGVISLAALGGLAVVALRRRGVNRQK